MALGGVRFPIGAAIVLVSAIQSSCGPVIRADFGCVPLPVPAAVEVPTPGATKMAAGMPAPQDGWFLTDEDLQKTLEAITLLQMDAERLRRIIEIHNKFSRPR